MSDTAEGNKKTVLEKHQRRNLVTWEECLLILENFLKEENKAGSLVSYEINPELDTVGYLGEYFHLNLTYQEYNQNELKSKRLFVKTMPYQNPEMCEFIGSTGILKKESKIYMRLLNDLRKFSSKVWCAKCYLVKPDLFVIQNIPDLGYEPIKDVSKFLSKNQIKLILKGLAVMHASSIAYEQKYNVKIDSLMRDFLYEVTVSPYVVWYTAGVKAVLAAAPNNLLFQDETIQHFISHDLPNELKTVYTMVNPSKKYCNVFCHRDAWGGNVFFPKMDDPEKGAVFVDFQLCRYSPPAIDILMALYLNCRPTERKLIEKECYKFYYEEFTKEMLNMGYNANEYIKYGDLLKSLQEFSLFGAIYNCVAATILRVPGDYLKDMKLNRPDDFHHYTNVDRTKEVLELMKTNAEFDKYMKECIEDLVGLLLK